MKTYAHTHTESYHRERLEGRVHEGSQLVFHDDIVSCNASLSASSSCANPGRLVAGDSG